MSTVEYERIDPADLPVHGRVPKHKKLLAWVHEVAALTQPDSIYYCDGSEAEWHEMIDRLVASGTAVRLNEEAKPNSIYVRTDPDDVARVEDQTFICSVDENNAGPTNNWMDPKDMKSIMTKLYDGCMRGRVMYVMPFCMGPVDAPDPKFGVEISDSAYVVISMKIMTRMGAEPLSAMEETEADFVPALHSVGMPLTGGRKDVP